jgi:hypothetical protein
VGEKNTMERETFVSLSAELVLLIGPGIRAETLIEAMCKDKAAWDTVNSLVYKIMNSLQQQWCIDQA